jgi:arsenite methyltransferase
MYIHESRYINSNYLWSVLMKEKEIKEFVKERYSKIATKEEPTCACCDGSGNLLGEAQKQAKAMGYSEEEIHSIPIEAVYGLGCGNPTSLAEINYGETVLDLGSGGEIDVFLASQKVGDNGKVIGVDMTPKMVEKAEKNAKNGGYNNVEFKLGEIEKLPLKTDQLML